MNKIKDKKIFIFGIIIFFFAKLYLIVPVSVSINTPRTGDDALVYLWKGYVMLSKKPQEIISIKDVEIQSLSSKNEGQQLSWIRSNIAVRVLGNIYPTYSILSGTALKIFSDLTWAYALTELVGLLLMTIGLSWFFFEVTGPAVAGFSLIPLSFAILPGQGIASFIPSNITLSCFLILWAYLWRKKEKISLIITGFFIFLMLGMHPIAKIYLVLTPLLYWICLKDLKDLRNFQTSRLLLTILIAILPILILPKIFPILIPVPTALSGSINFTSGFIYNFNEAIKQINILFFAHNILWIFLLVGGAVILPKKVLMFPLNYLISGAVACLIISLFFTLPGFPAELFKRLWVLFFIIGALIGGRFLYESSNKIIDKSKFIISGILILISIAWWIIKYIPAEMNSRKEILISSELRKNISLIPSGCTILYAEAFISLQASLLLGGEKNGALVYPMLGNKYNLSKLINERRPCVLVAPSDNALNSLAMAKAKRFIKRQEGLQFEYVKEFRIQRQEGTPLNKIFLRFEKNTTKDIYITWESLAKNGIVISKGKEIISNKTIELNLPEQTETLRVIAPEMPFWLVGFTSNSTKSLTAWPWSEAWQLTYDLRYKKKSSISVDFRPSALLKKYDAKTLITYVDKNDPIISDSGGLVFIRTLFYKP
jgi:hypothetical protein